MFYNTEMLTKRGPLARVWMASHLSAKLSKSNLLQTSIPTSVQSILGEALVPMALRLSGQLLLGVARIYSKQAKYLLDDCNETLSKVKKAFRPGNVDLDENLAAGDGATAGQAGRGNAAITLGLQEGGLEDILNQYDYGGNQWDFANQPLPTATQARKSGKANVSAAANITLPDHSYAYGYDGGLDSQLFGEDNGLDEEFDADFELGILDEDGALIDPDNFDAPNNKKRAREGEDELRSEGDMSVEQGRDAAAPLSDRLGNGSELGFDDIDFDALEKNAARQSSLDLEGQGMGGFDGDYGGNDFDLGPGGKFDLSGLDMDLLDGGADGEQRDKTPQATSLDGDMEDSLGLTPRTAADLAKKKKAAAKKDVGDETARKAKKSKTRQLVLDEEIDLAWQAGRNTNVRFQEPSYLPSSRLHLRLLELASDPASAYLPQPLDAQSTNGKKRKAAEALEGFAPFGLDEQLTGMFALPSRRERIKLEGRERRGQNNPANGNKRGDAGAADEHDLEVEQGRRRQSSIASGLNWDDYDLDNLPAPQEGGEGEEGGMGGFDGDYGGGVEHAADFRFDLSGIDKDLGAGQPDNDDEVAGRDDGTPRAAKKSRIATRQHDGEDQDEREDAFVRERSYVFDEDALGGGVSGGPLAVFDGAMSSKGQVSTTQHTQSQSLAATEEDDLLLAGSTAAAGGASTWKWSKNTVKAIEVLRQELNPAHQEDDDAAAERAKSVSPRRQSKGKGQPRASEGPKTLRFDKVADKATRHAASAFFFELLVLSTRECVKIEQPEAYGAIEVQAKDRLWELNVGAQAVAVDA